jgi:hypothetical protein
MSITSREPKIDIYSAALTVPQNTSANSGEVITSTQGVQGAIQIWFRVNTEMTIAATKTITFTLKSDSLAGGADATHSSISFAAGTYAVNYEKPLFVIPKDAQYTTYVTVATDDAAASGKIDIFSNYLPR